MSFDRRETSSEGSVSGFCGTSHAVTIVVCAGINAPATRGTPSDVFGTALAYANNFLTASQTGYGLNDQDAAIIIVARHFSTPYAYSDAMWTKYGKVLPPMVLMDDPRTKQRATTNLYAVPGVSDLPNL